MLIFLLFGVVNTFAEGNPPTFPQCETRIFTENGDWSHYDFGSHEILGIGRREGRDDVYSLPDGNFLQCFCPVGSTDGIQTNWWNVQRAGLTSDQIAGFVFQGWEAESGADWNLYSEQYLSKNQNFSCAQITPIPTISAPTQRGLTQASAPVCTSEAVTVAPLYSKGNLSRIGADSIKITWIVTDGHAQKYGIHYGNDPDKLAWYTEVYGHETNEAVINSVPQGNIYFKVCSIGTCGDAICGSDVPTVLGATTKLPSTGTTTLIFLGFAPIGYYLYKRFRLY